MAAVDILLADDHNLVRAGFRALLKRIEGVRVVGEAGNGRDAWELVGALNPALALIDISMPLLNGLELTARVAAAHPRTRVIVLSMHATEDYLQRAQRAGAAGYLLKNSSPLEFEQAIRAVHGGQTYFNRATFLPVPPSRHEHRSQSARLDDLTSRHREILQLIGEGHSTKAIAGLLGVSPKTVEAQRKLLMKRLGLDHVTAVVRYAVASGLVSLET